MNITTDNYEAYLLDYVEGNLSPEGAAELKAFIAAQGLPWDELTEELPKLEAPTIAYENKESLKKRTKTLPLFVKIASVAATLAFLVVVFWRHDDTMPKQEMMAELKPIAASALEAEPYAFMVPYNRPYQFNNQTINTNQIEKADKIEKTEKAEKTERRSMTLVAEMQPLASKGLELSSFIAHEIQPNLPLPLYFLNDYYAFADYSDYDEDHEYFEQNPSLIDKGIIWLSDGRYDSFGHFINSALHRAKHDVVKTTTKVAMTAYYKFDYQLEEAKERWQDKWDQKEDE